MTRWSRILFAVAMVPACTSELGTSWVPQEVEVADTVEDLGDKAYSLLCDQFSSYVHELYSSQLLVKAACTAHALRTTRTTSDCMNATEACLETLPPPVENELASILAQASCTHSNILPTGCSAPVSELLDCLEDLRGAVERVQMSATCVALGSRPPPDWWKIVQPESCIRLSTTCRPHL